VGLVGAGGIAVEHAAGWVALGAQLRIFSLDGAEQLAATCGATVAGSFGELLETCDVLDVVTPTDTHHGYALQALAAGKHVVCEKPLARTGKQAEELVQAAARTGVHLYPAHVVRYFPQYAALRSAVADGSIGRPAVLRFTRSGVFPSWSPWFADESRSGGIVMDQMIHDLDIARWVAGEVTEVYALHTEQAERQTAHVTLTHASGAVSLVAGLWGPPHLAFRTTFHVAGDQGVLRHDSAETTAVRADLGPVRPGGEPRPASVGAESPYLAELRDFATAIAGGPAPRVDAVDGLVAVRLAEAALESIALGRPVPVDSARWVTDAVAGGALAGRNA
jgi:myo-inositol 2-dehydrogenase/D-chiro-inositol 1-dehydrogenase